jgi:hypothetical protein
VPDKELDIELLAERIARELDNRRDPCSMTEDELHEVRGLLRTKKSSVRIFLWLTGALAIWVLKDVYGWIAGHLAFN